jgi:predicted DNA-binding transcriptional regulator AlpA
MITKEVTISVPWTIQEVSEFLRVPIGTLYQWRYRRYGPRASKIGKHLRYDPAEVRAWLAGQAS